MGTKQDDPDRELGYYDVFFTRDENKNSKAFQEDSLEQEIALVRISLRHMLAAQKQVEAEDPEAALKWAIKTVEMVGKATAYLGKLLQIKQAACGNQESEFAAALSRALDNVADQLRLDEKGFRRAKH